MRNSIEWSRRYRHMTTAVSSVNISAQHTNVSVVTCPKVGRKQPCHTCHMSHVCLVNNLALGHLIDGMLLDTTVNSR